jgi:integrase
MMVEFPVSVKKSTRKPHYMSATEQGKIEIAAPSYLRNIVVILSEIGLRYKNELLPMKKEQVDLENGLVHIAESKTANGIGDMPLTQVAIEAFRRQMDETPGSNYLSPQPETGNAETVHDQSPQSLGGNVEESRGAKFRPYELRHTFATRLSAGGVADHMVTQMLRQGDAEVFKLYSQAKLGMMREALTKLDRQANERGISSTRMASRLVLCTFWGTLGSF